MGNAIVTHEPEGATLVRELMQARWDYFSGVPCSLLAGAFQSLDRLPMHGSGPVYLPAPREDSAVAAAAGAYLAGRNPVVLMQNSGLGYCLNTFTSLHLIYSIPLIVIVSWRGFGPDAIEHRVMGHAMPSLLDDIDIPHQPLRDVTDAVAWSTRVALTANRPVALIAEKAI